MMTVFVNKQADIIKAESHFDAAKLNQALLQLIPLGVPHEWR